MRRACCSVASPPFQEISGPREGPLQKPPASFSCPRLLEHDDDDAAVLGAALRRLVAHDGLRVSVGDRGDAAERELVLAREVPADGLCALLAELVVGVGATRVVGVPLDLEIDAL